MYGCPLLERVGRCGFGGQGITNGIRADPRGCTYGSACGHRAHVACGPEMGHGMTYGADIGRTVVH
jgi:hypothetical protein